MKMLLIDLYRFTVILLLFSSSVLLRTTDLIAQFDWKAAQKGVEESPFRIISEEEVHKELLLVTKRYAELKSAVDASGNQSSSWKQFLIGSKLEINSANEEEIKRVIRILSEDQAGIEWQPLQNYRRELEQYLRAIVASKSNSLSVDYPLHRRALALAIQDYEKSRSPIAYAKISQLHDWAVNNIQMQDQLSAIRAAARSNNVDVTISKRLISEYVRDSFERPRDVSDCILGTAIKGCGVAKGSSDVELFDKPGKVELNVVIKTSVATKTIGANGPVRIHSDGLTNIVTYKPIVFDGNSFRALPSYSKAVTDSKTTGIDTNFSGGLDRLVRKIAAKQIVKKKGESNFIAAKHAEVDTNKATDLEVDAMLVEGNRTFYNEVVRPGAIRGFLGSPYSLSTSRSSIRFATLIACKNQLGAVDPPIQSVRSGDVNVSLHQSSVNNLLTTYLAGKRFSTSDLSGRSGLVASSQNGLGDGANQVSAAAVKKDTVRQIAVTLDSTCPVEMVFEPETVFVKVRATTIEIDDQSYAAMNIGMRFRISRENGTWNLCFDGEPIISPVRMELNPAGKLSGPEIAVRRIIRNLIIRDFPKKTPIKDFPLMRDKMIIGSLVPFHLKSDAGWFHYAADFAAN